MSESTIGIIMNGVSGRMGYRQHLCARSSRSANRAVSSSPTAPACRSSRCSSDATRRARRARRAARPEALHDRPRCGARRREVADLRRLPRDQGARIRDHEGHRRRQGDLHREADSGELRAGARAGRLAEAAGIKNGVVHDKLYLPGLRKLRRLIDSGFFGRILSVRGEFGYWVFEGDWMPAQRPSWNYRSEDGGGIIVDMFPHWNYVLENLFGRVESVYARAVTEIPQRVDENGNAYRATADDAAYAVFDLAGGITAQLNSGWTTRVNRDELVEFQVDGTLGSAVVGLFGCKIQPRNATPRPTWNPDVPDTHDYAADWIDVPTNEVFENGFKVQWEEFIRHVVEDAPNHYDFLAGARGVLLAEKGPAELARGPPHRPARVSV